MINIEDKEDAGQFLPQVRSYNLGCPYSMDDLREDLGPKVASCTEVPIQIMKFPKQTRVRYHFFPNKWTELFSNPLASFRHIEVWEEQKRTLNPMAGFSWQDSTSCDPEALTNPSQ